MTDEIVTPSWWHSPELDELDRRTRKTREALYKALVQLLGEKPLKNISVTELTRAADVNRSTFYTHFQDVYDMYEHMHSDFRSAIRAQIEEHAQELARGDISQLLHLVYSYFSNHRDMFGVIFGQGDNEGYWGDVVSVVQESLLEVLPPILGCDPKRMEHAVDFIARGSVGMARGWVEDGCIEGVDDMVALNTLFIDAVRNTLA